MAKDQKVYMPLMIGDWLKGTSGMKAEVRGVYLRLLLHQWDNGFIPGDWEELCLIDPEIPKVWDKLKVKFVVIEGGNFQNIKMEEVRAFWAKQAKNGKKGGRPKNGNPNDNPESNPKDNLKRNHHNDLDIEHDIELKLKGAFNEIYLDQEPMKWPHLDFNFELTTFCNKVRGSPEHYQNHDTGGIKLAFQKQLRESKNKKNGQQQTPNKHQQHTSNLAASFAKTYGSVLGGGETGQGQ